VVARVVARVVAKAMMRVVARSGGESGGGESGIFPPAMSSPAPGSTLTGSSVTFTGGHTSQDTEHWLYVGTSVGAKNLHDSGSMDTGHTTTVSGLTTSGTIHVRWWSRNSSGWQGSNLYHGRG
jgi:hypothetical protein